MLGTEAADLVDLLPEGLRPTDPARGPIELSVAARAAAAAFDLVPWPDADAVSQVLADPVAAAGQVAPLADRVLGAASAVAGAVGRPDVVWLFALAPRAVPFYVRMGDALAADPKAEQRLAAMICAFRADLVDPTTAGRTDGAATAAQLLHRVPALPVGRDTVDGLVDLLVTARRRGTPARHVVDAAVGLLTRLERAPSDPSPGETSPGDPSPRGLSLDGPVLGDATRKNSDVLIARRRQRQARIDGIRAAVALLAELQSYPPTDKDPRDLWNDLITVARQHGLAAIGVQGDEEVYQPHLHERLDDDESGDDPNGPAGDEVEEEAAPVRTVRVVRSGYTWAHGGEVVVLQRALVRCAPPD